MQDLLRTEMPQKASLVLVVSRAEQVWFEALSQWWAQLLLSTHLRHSQGLHTGEVRHMI